MGLSLKPRLDTSPASVLFLLVFLLLLLIHSPAAMAGMGDVASFQKISATQGGFTGQIGNSAAFGLSIAFLGDVDGDSVSDIAVGVGQDPDAGTAGAVWILFLNPNGTVKANQKITNSFGGFSDSLEGGDYFGRSVGGLGDLDGDSIPDLAVGAPGDDDGTAAAGAVYVLFLNADGTVKAQQKISATLGGFTGVLATGDEFGWTLTSMGDVDGDSVTDLAVGAPSDNDGGNDQGAFWILFLNSDGTVKAHQKISETTGGFTGILDAYDNFGAAAAGLGDLDGDSIPDLAAGASGDDDAGNGAGAVWILFLNSDGTVKSNQKITQGQGGFSAYLLGGDAFGSSVAQLGDLDDDGVTDLVVGAKTDRDGALGTGAAYILFLDTDGTIRYSGASGWSKISDTQGNFLGNLDGSDYFGTSVAPLGDLNGDGVLDFVSGATGDDDGSSGAGAAWVVFLDSLDCTVTPAALDFGFVQVGDSLDLNVSIHKDNGDGGLAGYVEESCEQYSVVSGGGSFLLTGLGTLNVTVRFSPAFVDTHTCVLHLNSTWCPDIPLVGIGSVCRLQPASLDFGVVPVGASATDSVQLTNTGSTTIDGVISGLCPHFSIISGDGPYSLGPGDSLCVSVLYSPSTTGPHTCTIDTGNPFCADIPMIGSGSDAPACALSPSSLDFGRVLVGNSRDSLFTIGNSGAGTLSGNVSLACPQFSIVSGSGPFSLGMGETIPVNVRFSPTAAGTYTCLVDLGSVLCSRLVYAATDVSGLTVIEADDPANPTGVSSFDTSDRAWDLSVVGPFAYVADGGSGLQIISIGDPSSPVMTGHADTPGDALDVAVGGTYAYIADGDSGLTVVDIGDALHPAVVGRHVAPGHVEAVAVDGTHAYLAMGQNGLYVADVSDPTSPVFAGSVDTPGSAREAVIVGTHAYLADGPSGLRIYDVTSPAAPGFVGSLALPGEADGLAVKDSVAYVTSGSAGLVVVDVSDPANPGLLGNVDTQGSARRISLLEGYAYVADGDSGIVIVDVNAPASPSVAGRFTTASPALGVAAAGSGDAAVTGYSAFEHPVITSVVDVPNDQGGHVRVHLDRSIYDFAEETANPITSYAVWRRVDGAAAPSPLRASSVSGPTSMPFSGSSTSPDFLRGWPLIENGGRWFVQSSMTATGSAFPDGTWEVVQSFPALQTQNYIVYTSTLADSTYQALPYAVFVVTAHTAQPSVWFASPPDSGYSVDNLAPGVPQGFSVSYGTGSGNSLSWDPASEPDFQFFSIYRSTDPGFIPGPADLVDATVSSNWTDPDHDNAGVYYKITATDHAGNESDPATPDQVTGVFQPRLPTAFSLYQNAPNPVRSSTTIRYDVPADNTPVTLRVYDIHGRLVRTLVDGSQSPGVHYAVWNGLSDEGVSLPPGAYFYRLMASKFVQTRKMVKIR